MRTVYYSDLLEEFFESEQECKEAEKEYQEKKNKKEKEKELALKLIDDCKIKVNNSIEEIQLLEKELEENKKSLEKSKDKLRNNKLELTKAISEYNSVYKEPYKDGDKSIYIDTASDFSNYYNSLLEKFFNKINSF